MRGFFSCLFTWLLWMLHILWNFLQAIDLSLCFLLIELVFLPIPWDTWALFWSPLWWLLGSETYFLFYIVWWVFLVLVLLMISSTIHCTFVAFRLSYSLFFVFVTTTIQNSISKTREKTLKYHRVSIYYLIVNSKRFVWMDYRNNTIAYKKTNHPFSTFSFSFLIRLLSSYYIPWIIIDQTDRDVRIRWLDRLRESLYWNTAIRSIISIIILMLSEMWTKNYGWILYYSKISKVWICEWVKKPIICFPIISMRWNTARLNLVISSHSRIVS